MIFYEILWDFIRFYEFLWVFMILWDIMRYYEILWQFMNFYEILWVFLHNVQKYRNKNSPAPAIRTKKELSKNAKAKRYKKV